MAGYIKIHRKLLKWGWYHNPCVKDVFIHLLLIANYQPAKFEEIVVERGQAVFKRETLANEVGFSVQQIRTALKKLEKTGEITIDTNNRYTIATIINYNEYQDVPEQGQNGGEQPTNNQQITRNQPTNNHQITINQPSNNHIKRNKEVKNIRSSSYIYTPPRTSVGEEERARLIEIWGAENVQ